MTSSLRPSSVEFFTVEMTLPMTRASCISKNFYDHERQIIMLMCAGGEFIDSLDESVNDRRSAQVAVFEQKFEDPRLTEFDAMRLRGVSFCQTIGVKEKHVALLQMHCFALVLLLVKNAEQQAARFESAPFTGGLYVQREIMSGIAVLHGFGFAIDQRIDRRHQQLPAQVAMHSQVCVAKDACGAVTAMREASQNAPGRRHPHGCTHAFPRNIGDQNSEPVRRKPYIV